jgi:hypothetical protein
MRCRIAPVSITTGNTRTELADGSVHLSDAALVSRLLLLFASGRLELPTTMDKRPIMTELLGFRGRLSRALHVLFGADVG